MFRKERIPSEVWIKSWATLAFIVLTVGVAPGVMATDWAKAMFDQTTHDFGMVARGSVAECRFNFENIYLEDVHVKSISSSCRCTSVKVTEPSLKTHEKSQVVATLNTRQFTGKKDATIRLVLDKPFPAEVQLHVHSYIRTDVVLEPGSVQFGQVTEGKGATKVIDLRHAGNPDWRITGCERADESIDVAIKTVSTTSDQGVYQLAFTLKPNAPAGYIRRHITLLTNDQNPSARRVLVPIEGVVSPAVTVRPSPLNFGLVRPGREATARIVVQGQESFQVLSVEGPDERFALDPSAKLGKTASVHLLTVTFHAGSDPGKIEGKVRIQTDIGGGKTLEVDVAGEVVAGSQDPSPAASAPSGDGSPSSETSSPGWRSVGG